MSASLSHGLIYAPAHTELMPFLNSNRESVYGNVALAAPENKAFALGKAGIYQIGARPDDGAAVFCGDTAPVPFFIKIGSTAATAPHYIFFIPIPGFLLVNVVVTQDEASLNVYNASAITMNTVWAQRLGA